MRSTAATTRHPLLRWPALIALVVLASGTVTGTLDTDGDGVDDAVDNCIETPNPSQSDVDLDGVDPRIRRTPPAEFHPQG